MINSIKNKNTNFKDMERPARRNLFDDSEEEDEENEYKPKPETEEDGNKEEESNTTTTTMAKAAEEPVEGLDVEEVKEEGAIALN
jgi:nitrogen fixation-related uncharacterized protein